MFISDFKMEYGVFIENMIEHELNKKIDGEKRFCPEWAGTL